MEQKDKIIIENFIKKTRMTKMISKEHKIEIYSNHKISLQNEINSMLKQIKANKIYMEMYQKEINKINPTGWKKYQKQ